ncbi:MAG: DUF4982 domain-containing protein, partial [Gemmatimonadetes bacterium]|nr:DUF4982 domain-containing protein [Gemmatimonadota bacterium]
GTADLVCDGDFDEFALRNARNFVRRDRNHPAIFLWSVGNEIGAAQWNVTNGFARLHTLVSYLRRFDPTRPVTLVNDDAEAPRLRAFDFYDVLSWNYNARWRLARQLEPNKAVLITESASTVSTRGFYEFPLPDSPTAFTRSRQVSSYDLNAPAWADLPDDAFMWQQDEEYIAGEFVWTGFDYLGEPTPYGSSAVRQFGLTPGQTSRSSYFGIVDLVGIPKDRFWLYRAQWEPDEPTVHILPHWNWPDRLGQQVPVFVYTNGECAELLLNGATLGRRCKQPASPNAVERTRLTWKDVAYAPGELRAVAYREGAVIGEASVVTAGEAQQLRLVADRSTIAADGMDLSYVLVEALDRAGNPHPLSAARVALSVTGPATIAGVGNGDPQSLEPFQAEYVDLFHGKAMVILRGGRQAGRVTLTARAEGLQGGTVVIRTQ